MCKDKEAKKCRETSLKIDAKYFWGSYLALGNVTDISVNCICIKTRYCIPLQSMINLFLPFKRKVIDIPVRVEDLAHSDTINEILTVKVLRPSQEYLLLVEACSTQH